MTINHLYRWSFLVYTYVYIYTGEETCLRVQQLLFGCTCASRRIPMVLRALIFLLFKRLNFYPFYLYKLGTFYIYSHLLLIHANNRIKSRVTELIFT